MHGHFQCGVTLSKNNQWKLSIFVWKSVDEFLCYKLVISTCKIVLYSVVITSFSLQTIYTALSEYDEWMVVYACYIHLSKRDACERILF